MNYILLKELMKQSETECGFDSNKFAELIVRECAEWIKNTDSDPDIGKEDAKALLEHFGVEE
jgi:hypothetical protein